jgi:hypothetical protein
MGGDGGGVNSDIRHLAERQLGIFTREQARSVGLSDSTIARRVGRGEWVRLMSQVFRFAGTPVSWAQYALGATLLAGPGSALSHHAAAYLFRLDGLCERPPRPIDLTVRRNRHLADHHLRIHRTRLDVPIVWSGRLRVTSLARTLVDLSASLSEEALELALDSAPRQHRALDGRLAHAIALLPRPVPHGVATLRDLLALRAADFTDSPLEARVRRALRKTRLPPPALRYEVHDADGYVMRLDLAWQRHRTALHVDGYRWHHQRQRFERDARQRSRLAALGWSSLIDTHALFTSGQWLIDLSRALAEHDPQLTLAM